HQWLMNSLLVDESKISLSYQESSALNKNYDTTVKYGSRMRERDTEDKSVQVDAQFNKLI
ncbi:hypothetical protein, partial [Vibrio cholerae]